MASESPDPIELERQTAKRRVALVVTIILKGGDLCRGGGSPARTDGGGDRGLAGAVSDGGRERAPRSPQG